MTQAKKGQGNEPLWYKDAVIYQVHVKAFADGNNDGIGDLRGMIAKLDYVKDLGVTALWLLPFYPSPLRDDGYDIADYLDVHPDYGTLRDIKAFIRAAHDRGLKVITELVLNHTSDRHAWFAKARKAKPGTSARDFYVWSDTARKYEQARIIFQDFETSNWTWDNEAQAYFWHRFYSHQPDLNYDNPAVRRAMFKAIDYWLKMGVDGLRLDAVPYLFEREGTNCENLPETHNLLRELRAFVDERYEDRMLLAEANQWPEDAVAYFGGGDECHMAFHFPIMPRIFMSIWMEDRFPILDILEQTPAIPENCQWAMFLRNHDELTLEMVSDEERDYMYRVYARDARARINLGIRRRLAPLMTNHRRRIELINFILFSFPGTPIIYYGDEIGMGDNYHLGDRDGVRTPMQWSPDRNGGFSKANPQSLYLPMIIDPEYHYEVVNVENQEANPSSLLWWMRRVIATRKRYQAFGRGVIAFVDNDNPKVLCFVRRLDQDDEAPGSDTDQAQAAILVVVNLSRHSQVARLDLSEYAGFEPRDLFGETAFPEIGEEPYVLPLGPHNYFWFRLDRVEQAYAGGEVCTEPGKLPVLTLRNGLGSLLRDEARQELERALLARQKARPDRPGPCPHKIRILDVVPLDNEQTRAMVMLESQPKSGPPDMQPFFLHLAKGKEAEELQARDYRAVLARVVWAKARNGAAGKAEQGLLCDGLEDETLRALLLDLAGNRKKRLQGGSGILFGRPGPHFSTLKDKDLSSSVVQGPEQDRDNVTVRYGQAARLKLYSRLERGSHPEVEVLGLLGAKGGDDNAPPLAGTLEYQTPGRKPVVVGALLGWLRCESDAWDFCLEQVTRYLEIVGRTGGFETPPEDLSLFTPHAPGDLPEELQTAMGWHCLEMLGVLGRRLAAMHKVLAGADLGPSFAPEPLSALYLRSVYQSMRNVVRQSMLALKKRTPGLPENLRQTTARVLEAEPVLLDRLRRIAESGIGSSKTRIHGDMQLSHALFTGKDFVFVDFEGERERSLGDRRLKRTPLRDLAGLLYSLREAAVYCVNRRLARGPEDSAELPPWAGIWAMAASGVVLDAYLKEAGQAVFIPESLEHAAVMLECHALERAFVHLGRVLGEADCTPDVALDCILGLLPNEG